MRMLLQYPLLPLLSVLVAVLAAIGLRTGRRIALHAAAAGLCALLVAGLALGLPEEALLLLPLLPLTVSLCLWKGDAP